MILAKFSQKEKIGFFCAALALFLVFLDRIVIFPVGKKLEQINKETKISTKKLERSYRNLAQKGAIEQEYSKYCSFLMQKGSDEEEMAVVLSKIEELARASGVALVEVKPHSSKKEDSYQKYIIEVMVEGEVRLLVDFLYSMNVAPQPLRAEKIRVDLKEKGSSVLRASAEITKVLFL